MAILFDLDGTLVDTAPDIIEAIHNLCKQLHKPLPDPKFLQDHTSFGLQKLLEVTFPGITLSDQELAELKKRFRQLYQQTNFVNSKLFPGIAELLEKIHQAKLQIGVVTNKNLEFAEKILANLNLTKKIDCLVTADLVGKAKPAPDPVLLALRQLNAPATKSIFIGDAEQDLIAGKLAGVKTVLALFGYIGDLQIAYNWPADHFVTKPQEIWDLIEKWRINLC